ncbi:restriction endonuclease [Streptomyces sp. NPDC007907]|uniref:restriction endonuclease n=1 Tax=Streptomyces sp. NPDC007907 TaxID=3364789 RepID=UPI0036E0FB49
MMSIRMPFWSTEADDWRSFERLVAQQVRELDANATVHHDAKLTGIHSKAERQIDVLASVPAIGGTLRIAFECKLHKRAVGITTAEEFIGKLLDLRVDRGILCVFGGVTPAALRRLGSVAHPSIDLYMWHRDEPSEMDRTLHFQGWLDGYLTDMEMQDFEQREAQAKRAKRWAYRSFQALHS